MDVEAHPIRGKIVLKPASRLRIIHRATVVVALLLAAGCSSSPDRPAKSSEAIPAPAPAGAGIVANPAPASSAAYSPSAVSPPVVDATPPPLPALSSLMSGATQRAAESEPRYVDLLERIRAGLVLGDNDSVKIDRELNWYASHPSYIERVFDRAELYLHHIVTEVESRGLPLELALLPVIESAFEPYAYSRARASGLWQFIPGTGTRFGLKQDWWYDGRRDIVASTRAALDYLEFLHDEFDGRLAARGGRLQLRRARGAARRARQPGRRQAHRFLEPEAARGNARVRAEAARHVATCGPAGCVRPRVQHHSQRGVLPPCRHRRPRGPADRRGALGRHARGALRAEPCASSLGPPIPPVRTSCWCRSRRADIFRQALLTLTPDEKLGVTRYIVAKGDTVNSVAKRFDTTTQVVRDINGLGADARIAVGDDLRVPSKTGVLPPKVLRAAALVDGRRNVVAARKPKGRARGAQG